MTASGSSAHLVSAYAVPLPLGVICAVFGVRDEHRGDFTRWVAAATSAAGDAQTRAEGLRLQRDHIAELVAERRREPTEDLLGALVLARDEGDRLTEDELVVLGMGLLGAGFDTTAAEIANFAYLLLTHPDQWALLRAKPDLVERAVEELLRFAPLNAQAGLARYATRDVEVGGQTVRAGEPVLAFFPAANHDPSMFPNPDELDITRADANHLAFGFGAHYCMGAQLARMELQVAFAELAGRLPELRLAVREKEVVWRKGVLVRGPVALPVAW
jgi:cytochrome P450